MVDSGAWPIELYWGGRQRGMADRACRRATLTVALLPMALLPMALLTMALLTMALLITMALLTMAVP